MSYKNYPMVSRVVFGRGSFNQLGDIIEPKRLNVKAPFIFLVDDVFKGNPFITTRIPIAYSDELIFVSADEEPKTTQVDELVEKIILTQLRANCVGRMLQLSAKQHFVSEKHATITPNLAETHEK